MSVITVHLLSTRLPHTMIYLPFHNGHTWEDMINSTGWGRAVDNGSWYNFSRPPLFVFYVYSAFLVDHEPQEVIRLISITSPIELFARRQLNVFCVVRYSDRSKLHVASILHRPPRRITELGRVMGYKVGDYVYRCPLPKHRQEHIPVSIF